jgi:xanthine dehydrogenase accessory factor
LRDNGVAEEIIAQIHSHIGIKIGANTPAEIAISILAEIIQVRSSAGAEPKQAVCCNPRA